MSTSAPPAPEAPWPGDKPYLNGIHDDFKAADGEHLGFPQRMVVQVAVREKNMGGQL